MEDNEIIDYAYGNREELTDTQIGEFVRRALTEDITKYDLEKEMGLYRGGE